MKKPENALNVEHMNVKDGGKQPFMRDTTWNGQVQCMVTDEGIQNSVGRLTGLTIKSRFFKPSIINRSILS